MLFSNWYFCYTLKMSITDAGDYLECLFTLEDSARSLKEKNIALDWLEREEDPLLQAYAVPVLVNGILEEGKREWESIENEERAQRSYLHKSKRLILALLEKTEQISQMAKCSDLIRKMDEMEYGELLKKVMELPYIEPDHKYEFTYLESEECAYPIIWLSVLCAVAKVKPHSVSEALAENRPKYLNESLDREFGRLPWKLAMVLQCLCGRNFEEVSKNFTDDWLGSAECLEIAAHLLLEKQKRLSGTSENVVRSLMEESHTLSFFEKNRGAIPKGAFWISEKASAGNRYKICAVLWQNTLWNTAFEYDAVSCAKLLRTLWNTPVYRKMKESDRWEWRNLLIPSGAWKGDKEQYPDYYFCTPWQRRTRKRTEETNDVRSFQEFKDMAHNESAFRVFAAAVLLRRMMGTMQEFPVEYCRILLNMGDVFQCADVEPEVSGKQKHWEKTVAILGYFAKQCVGMLGRGELNDRVPKKIIDMIRNGRKNTKNNMQLNEQYKITGIQVCARWAVESLRSGRIRRGYVESPWFSDGQNSSAVQLCQWFFEDGIHQEDYDYREPILLYCQAFPEEYRQIVDSGDNISWIEKYSGSKDRVTFCDVMLSGELFVEEWESLNRLKRERFDHDIWLSVLTMRLLALLRSGRLNEYQSWYTEWKDELAASVSEKDTDGVLFYFLCELLTVTFPKGQMPHDYPEIMDLVIYTIHHYTTERTIFYQYCLTERLERAWEKYGLTTGSGAVGKNITELYKKRMMEKERELLEWSMARAKSEMPDVVLRKIYESLDIYWKQICASGRHHSIVRLEPEEWNPLTDFGLQDNQGQLSVVRPVQDMERVFGAKTKNLFKDPTEAEPDGWYVGIVMNEVFNIMREQEKRYSIQYGAGSVGYCVSRAYYRKGEVVGVHLDVEGKPDKLGKMAWKDDEKPLAVEVMEFSSGSLKLRLPNKEICFVSENKSKMFHTMLSLWEPDTARLLQRNTEKNKGEQQIQAKTREVYYDETKEFYVPVKRDFYRLILECFFAQKLPGQMLRLVFIHQVKRNRSRGFLFSTEMGINYLLSEKDWEEDSFARLEEKLKQGSYRQGLIVMVGIKESEGILRLSLAEEQPFCEKNWEWDDCFSEEEVFTIYRNGTGKNNPWYVNTDVADMPQRVAARLTAVQDVGTQTICNVQLCDNGWNIGNQRRGEVRVEQLRSRNLNKAWRTPDGFRQLREVNPGDMMTLKNKYLRKQREGYHLMGTESGLPVFCASESLSLEVENIDVSLISDRVCVVEYVDLREAKPRAIFEAVKVPALEGCGNRVEGLLAQFTEELNSAGEETKELSLEVWLKIKDRVVSVMAPASAFESSPRALGVPILAVKQDDGRWLFKAYNRRIQVRALWRIEDHRRDCNSRISGIRLGSNMKIPGYGDCLVTQAKDCPILYLWKKDTLQKEEEESVCGVELGTGRVSALRRRNFPWEVFPYAKQKEIVKLAVDGREFYGDCAWGEFDNTNKEVDWSVGADVYLFRIVDDRRYYDLRRSFYSRSIKKDTENNLRSTEQKLLLNEQYENWINEGDYHVIGALVAGEENPMLRMENLKVPQTIGQETLRDKWTDKVFFAEKERRWVLGRDYSENRMRAILLKKNDIWVASCLEASPFYVNAELAREFNTVSGDVIDTALYYAGLDENNRMRFEWGYGFTFLADEEDIVDEDGHKIGNNLFYGDMIKSFVMIEGEGNFGWRIHVEYKAIVRQVEGRVWDDSFGGGALVQLLKIRRDLEEKKIYIERVSVTERGIGQDDAGLYNGWDYKPISSARLEEESVQILLEEEGYDRDETKIIFAQLRPGGDMRRMTRLTFAYMPLDGKKGDTWLLEGRVVCMAAGEIVPTGSDTRRQNNRLGNDYMISLYLPNELPDDQKNPQMCVNVLRREFSVDESCLRTLYPNNKRKYYGCKMVVCLKTYNRLNRGRNEWRGNIIATPKRTLESLKIWVASQGDCLVMLGVEKKKLLAEIAPGIISYLPESAIQGTVSQGALASLWMEGEILRGRTVMPGDDRYLPCSGRPAELLVMDGAAKKYARLQQEAYHPGSLSEEECKQLNTELDKYQFTVAGLPQILLSDRELLGEVVSSPIPRLAYLARGQERSADMGAGVFVQSETAFCAARLCLNQQDEPELHYFYPKEYVKEAAWEDISFLDGTIPELITFLKRGRWHYHDRNTAFYHYEKRCIEALPLPDGENYRQIIVFPNGEGKLRYQQEELFEYGFPAREVAENGLPEQGAEYPIAGVTEDSIWIEVFPGKVLEIPVGYLYVGEKKIPLSGLWTKMLFPGDRVRLCQDKGYAGNQRKLILQEVTFGGRAVLGKRNTFLPVKSSSEDGFVLGTELWPITLPVKVKAGWSGKKLFCISENNGFTPVQENRKPSAGDVLLVSNNMAGMFVVGWNSLKLNMAYRDLWKNAEWLMDDMLKRDRRKGWLEESGITIPMEIHNVKSENKSFCAYVFFRQPNMDALLCGTKLCCICAGLRWGKNGAPEMVVRTGRSLLSIPAQNILPGIRKEKMGAVARALREKRTAFWIHKEETGWYSGLREILEKEQIEIQMLFCVEEAKGILCLTKENLALRWIPADRAVRAGVIKTKILWEALCVRRERPAARLGQGVLSLVDTWQNEQKYEILKTDGTRYRAIPRAVVYKNEGGTNCYLAELYPWGDLICLYSEKDYDCNREDPIPIVIGEKQIERVISYPYGTRRRALHLTPWIYKALGNAAVENRFDGGEEIDIQRFRREIPDCFAKYRGLISQADQDSEMGRLDYGLLRSHERISEQLIYLYEVVSKKRDEVTIFNEVYEFIRLTLKAWLQDTGRFLASGLDPRERRGWGKQIDLAPVIAAVLLLNLIKGKRNESRLEEVAKPLSVHLTRMLGIICGSSIHQELLLRDWLLTDERKPGLWLRLNQLPLRGEDQDGQISEEFDGQLTPRQVRRVLDICNSLKLYTSGNKELMLVLESVLLSIGCLEDCDTFCTKIWSKKCITERLSVMGRILTPCAGENTAGNHLRKEHVENLEGLWTELLQKDGLPLSLVIDTPVPITDMVKENGISLCEKFCEQVEPPRKGRAGRDWRGLQ